MTPGQAPGVGMCSPTSAERTCIRCGRLLERMINEKPYLFRQRNYCSSLCRNRANSEQKAALWRDPIARERFQRGIHQNQFTTDHQQSILRMRTIMLERWQNPQYVQRMQGRRRLTAEQIKAIRADTRSIRAISRDYGLSYAAIHKICKRLTYCEIE